MFLLDTNVVSELRKAKAGNADANVTAWVSGVPYGSLFISAITVLELEMGNQPPPPKRKPRSMPCWRKPFPER
jgi:predicted nucleic acid-binding protein